MNGKIPPYNWKLYNLHVMNNCSNVWETVLQNRYKNNAHYPEHYSKPSHMTILNKQQILCDMLASVLGSQWKQNGTCTIENAAYICRGLDHWNLVKDLYTGSFKQFKCLPRWKKNEFDDEKHHFIIWFKCLLHEKISFDEFMTGLYSFKCIKSYVLDLQWYQYALFWVYNHLFSNNTELRLAIEKHDADKWDAFIMATYVLKFIFNIEEITISKEFKLLSIDSFIYDRSNKGLTVMIKDGHNI